MKYYVGHVQEQYGEYEASSILVFQVRDGEDVEDVVRRLSEEYREGKLLDGGWYVFDFGMMHTPIEYYEVTEAEYTVLFKHIHRIGV